MQFCHGILPVVPLCSVSVSHQVLQVSLEQLKLFADGYRAAIMTYRDAYFADRSRVSDQSRLRELVVLGPYGHRFLG